LHYSWAECTSLWINLWVC